MRPGSAGLPASGGRQLNGSKVSTAIFHIGSRAADEIRDLIGDAFVDWGACQRCYEATGKVGFGTF